MGDPSYSASIFAALLAKRVAALDARVLADALNQTFAASELVFSRVEAPDGVVLDAGELHVILSSEAGPLPSCRTAAALTSRLPDVIGEPWADWAAAEGVALTIRVVSGPYGALPHLPSADAFDTMLSVLHVCTGWLASSGEAEAIFWSQSNQFFSANRFLCAVDMLYPLPVYLHPRPLAPEAEGPPDRVGFDLEGAAQICGHAIRFEPSTAPLCWMAERAYALVTHLRCGNDVPPVFGVATGERIEVARQADGTLNLSLTLRDGGPVMPPSGDIPLPSEKAA
ncbi:hypothetical protein RM543_15680 [Roseicyclus sp. F158]|uniref:DUF4261 domain-containing protein n=1 Tax=Tropicimonas omnivorans TaxID=3075590 RepID=A0ABU3DKC7_9RHOB|nr:hypothetical protein [Roseicyclus sp. F158]MDT0684126.1 hypothetical protein [Roseicyclus sp. F158]